MEVLHHPAVQAFHWICSIAMVGIALDPTGVGATIGNYVGHIGSGLGNLFNAAAGAETVAHAGHAATAATTQAAAAHTSHALTIAPGIETGVHTGHAFSAAASPDACAAWLQGATPDTAAQVTKAAGALGMTPADYVCANHMHM